MKQIFVDLHVHIGRSSQGHEVKKATANNLTFENIAYESYNRKGIDVIGVADAVSPHIINDIEYLLDNGIMTEDANGGIKYKGRQMIILGGEIETHQKGGGNSHSLCFFPSLRHLKEFSKEMEKYFRNIYRNSIYSHLEGQELFNVVDSFDGTFIPAHAFTPYKSFYGSSADSLLDIFNEQSYEKIPSVELGLSADSYMASQVSELDGKSFISNSDAHSLGKMGREYNIFQVDEVNYNEILMALKGENGRKIVANYGLNPKLGKYHRTFCVECDRLVEGEPPVLSCNVNPRHEVVVGVFDRLEVIKDRNEPMMKGRPPYHYQVPLEFLPKVGPKTIDKLIEAFGSEMAVLHNTTFEELSAVVKEEIAKNIVLAREGKLDIHQGGGGIYGKIEV